MKTKRAYTLYNWNATAAYILLQAAAWSFYAVILSFSSNVLRGFGFSDSRISLLLGVSAAVSFLLQLAVAELVNHFPRLTISGAMTVLGTAMLLANGLMLKRDLPAPAAVAAFALACVIVHMTPTFANAMGMDAIERGSPTNYSLARGMGSLVYSILAYLTGMLVGKYGTPVIPVVGAVCAAALIAATLWYHLAGERGLPEAAPKTAEAKKAGFLKQYPKFAVFLVGAVFLHFSHNVLSNFMYQIMLSKHGGAGEQGTATAIAALVELPVMFGFPLMLRWMGSDKWVRLCGFGMAIKGLGLFLATTPYGVYAAQATQIIGYGLYAISSVNYAAQVVGKGESVRAQSYLGSTTTVGALAALSTGGVVCQHFGSQAMVLTSFACAMTGAVIILLAAGGRRRAA